jgi:hypothetical protein
VFATVKVVACTLLIESDSTRTLRPLEDVTANKAHHFSLPMGKFTATHSASRAVSHCFGHQVALECDHATLRAETGCFKWTVTVPEARRRSPERGLNYFKTI